MAKKFLRIRVGPYTYRQRWVPEKLLEERQAYAMVDLRRRSILLADTCDYDRAVENLIHEVVEIVNHQYELELEHWKINTMGLGIAQALMPIIKKWW